MNRIQCGICNTTFDSVIHRPRALPCGHGFCTTCIGRCIHTGSRSCPMCRREHGANAADELPVSFLLEDAMLAAQVVPQPDLVTEDGTVTMCPKHTGVPCYFHCKSHNIKVCHSCCVRDHLPTSCNLLSLEEEMAEKKETQMLEIQNNKKDLMDTKNDLKLRLSQEKNEKYLKENEIKLLLTKIELIKSVITKNDETQHHINEAIQECQDKQEAIDIIENNLSAAISRNQIEEQCEVAKAEILNTQVWEEELRNKLDLEKVSAPANVYTVVFHFGVRRCSKVFHENGKAFIPSLNKEVNPTASAKLIKENELGLTSDTATVYMEFGANGLSLGRVIIKVKTDRLYGRQFVMVALGINGPTFKGSKFSSRRCYDICLKYYITESGRTISTALLPSLKRGHYDAILKGRLFPSQWTTDNASFNVITRNKESGQYFGYFGNVVSGIEVIDKLASNEFAIEEIIIRDCGIILDY